MKNGLIIGSMLLFIATSAFSTVEPTTFNRGDNTSHKTNKAQRELNRELRREKLATQPNYTTEQNFLVQFPDATNISWKRDGFEEAAFTMNGKDMKAFYDYNNELVGTTSPVSYAELPADAQQYLEKHYADYTSGTVIMYDDNEYNDTDMMLYGNTFQDEDNYFVEMSNNQKKIVLQVNMEGLVTFFKDITYSNVK
jgi:hypothetical protein